jgi:hypothetical protein
VGLVAGCVLALQVLLTRLFSAALFYHFSFLSISLALLGAGAGAIVVYVRPAWFARRALEGELARWAAAFAVLLAVVPLVIVRVRFGADDGISAPFVAKLAFVSLLTTLLFGAGGLVVALAVRGYTQQISRLYAMDLAGAAAGALVVVPLLWAIPAPVLLVALAPVAAAAAMLFAGASRLPLAALAVGVLATSAAALTDAYAPPPTTTAPPGLAYVSDTWTPLSRVVGYPPPKDSRFALVFYDRVYAPAPVVRAGAPLPDWRTLRLGPQSLGYVLGGRSRALIIGGGGGRDILNALSSGVRRVDVIELNRAIRDTVDGPLRRWTGAPYTMPRVHTRIGDGRSTLARDDATYDVVHIGFTDTLSANSAQAFALTEANLYTVEAFGEYLDHLGPRGVLDVSRLYRLVGDEALRVTVLTLEALRRRGVADPSRNVVVVLGRDIFGERFGTVLARNTAWTAPELARIRRLAHERGEGVAFAPGGPYADEWAQLHAAPSVRAFCKGYRLDVCAPTDDKPFFFQMKRLGSFGQTGSGYIYAVDPFVVLLWTFAILAVLSLALVAAPLMLTARRERPPTGDLVLFAAIGFGFLTLEVALIQRFVLFLGFPTYALSVVLFALLVSTGAGALVTARVRNPRRALTVALAAGCALIAASAFGLRPLLEALITLPFAARVAMTVVLLAPLGAALGMAMPLGLQRLAALHPASVAWAWGVNGIASVLASAAAVAIAIVAGFPAATLVALGCYLVALAHARFGRWPDDSPTSALTPPSEDVVVPAAAT